MALDQQALDGRLLAVRLVAMDVDGVQTDGAITWSVGEDGGLIESKSFNARDGLAHGLLRAGGISVAWVTGRRSLLVERRARELRVDHLCQGARDKRFVLRELARALGLAAESVLYIADDLNDLPAFEAAGVRVAVADAVEEVRLRADWVTASPGGGGAVREVADRVLRSQGRWRDAVDSFLERLREEQSEAGPWGQ